METSPGYAAYEAEIARNQEQNRLQALVLDAMTRSSTGFSFEKGPGKTDENIRADVRDIVTQTLRAHSTAEGAARSELRNALIAHFMEHQRDYQERIKTRRQILRSPAAERDTFSLNEREILLRDAEKRSFPPDVESH